MIRLGYPYVSIFPNNGIIIDNHGGSILFKGKCLIGNNSAISVGPKATLEFGANTYFSTTSRIVCYHRIRFGDNTTFGWDSLIMDTDLHKMTKINGGYSKGFAPIIIGADNWFGSGCRVMKRTRTPNKVVVTASTVLNKKIDCPECCVIGPELGIDVKVSGIWRNISDDKIDYTQD